jgi:hypothetical protein
MRKGQTLDARLATAGRVAVAGGLFKVVEGFCTAGLAGVGLGGGGSSLHPHRKKSINTVIKIVLSRIMGFLLCHLRILQRLKRLKH